MDSAYIEMALPNCPLEVGECKNGAESVSSLTAFSNSSSLMHALEPSLDVVDVKLEPDLSEDMPPPNAIPGLAQFTTVEFSGFAQTPSSGTSDAPAGESFPGSAVSSAAGELSEGQGSSTSSAAVLAISQPVFQTPQHESSGQYVQQSHVLDHRPGSAVSASPGPSCGSGGSPAPSTSLSHPSVGSPWSFDVSCMPNSDNPAATSSLPSTTTTATTSVATVSALPSQSTDAPKLEKPQPPKKPLTPYMRFSKAIWQQVKAAHPSLSVCEVGAAIGKMWREMIETEKQRYNEDFAIDKVRYDDELQSYLKLTGLQASDLSKPKAKKKDTKLQTQLRPTNKPQVMPFATAEQMSGGAVAPGDHATPEPLATTVAVPGAMNGAALRATGFQTVGVGEDCSSLGTNLSTLPHFSQVWSGQEVYANQQLLAQMGFTPGQTIFTNHTMGGEAANTSGLITIQSQDVSQNEGPQVTALYSGQSQPLQNVGSQGVASHVQMSVGQIDNSNVMTSSDNAWLWQQYNTGNQFLQDAMTAQSSLPQSQNHDGVIIYQITSSDGAQSSLVQPSMESDLQANHQSLSGVVLAKPSSVAATNGTAEAVLEPGEVPLSGQTVGSNGPIEPGVYDLNQLCGLMSWNQTKDEKLRGFVQPVDGEKQLLRSALLEKSKEIQRLTRELELAYGLIHQLKQQNDLFQRHWNGQQQMQQQQQQQQQQLQQQQLQQQQLQQQQQQQLQQQLYIIPKTESTTGLSIST